MILRQRGQWPGQSAKVAHQQRTGRDLSVALAAIIYDKGFRIDDFMASVAAHLTREGIRVRGLVQENFGDDPNCSVMTLVDFGSSGRFGISQDLGEHARGCRLDPHGLAEAGGLIEQALVGTADLLVLNKFGKAEAEQGAGLRSTLACALDHGVPVLTAVREPYAQSWAEFHGGLAAALPAEIGPVLTWCRQAAAQRRAARDLASASAK
jgi:uncharacterized protein DUF2478